MVAEVPGRLRALLHKRCHIIAFDEGDGQHDESGQMTNGWNLRRFDRAAGLARRGERHRAFLSCHAGSLVSGLQMNNDGPSGSPMG